MRPFPFLKKIIFISRPRIWAYTLGSFLLGFSLGAGPYTIHLFAGQYLWLTLWLTLPANLFLYSLNDAFDYSTDANNPKKHGFENSAKLGERNKLLVISAISVAPLAFIVTTLPPAVKFMVFIWLFIVLTYNVPPVRLKGIPVLDMLFAFSFPLWGIIGYYLSSGTLPDAVYLLALVPFVTIMHLYTAITDLEYDRSVGLMTSAVAIGSVKANLRFCTAVFGMFAIFLIFREMYFLAFLAVLYTVFFSLNLATGSRLFNMVTWYEYFIYLQYVAGSLIFFYVFVLMR